jgi:K+-transporting ATPase KdpF subunit
MSAGASACDEGNAMNLWNVLLLVVCILLCGYLLYALLKAEEF